jgi:two-component system, OmpR family, alkaline phosphatase synthesis response regulator PhoP
MITFSDVKIGIPELTECKYQPMSMKNVLIIEDDKNISNLLQIHVKDLNCNVDINNNGREGYERASSFKYDLIILDVMLPEMDGINICQKLRALENYTPILMLTAKSEEFDKVLGLESGADDYLTKPFGIRELIARVKGILRRSDQAVSAYAQNKNYIKFKGLEIDLEKRKVLLDGHRIDLTPKEFDVLLLLATHPGKSFDRERLLSKVWGYDFQGYEHTVNSHINRLRAKIEKDLSNPQYILTTWGVGYRFNDEL